MAVEREGERERRTRARTSVEREREIIDAISYCHLGCAIFRKACNPRGLPTSEIAKELRTCCVYT